MALRNSLIAKIWNAIEQSPFTPADFVVDVEQKNSVLLRVEFRHDRQFFLIASEGYERVEVNVAPGELRRTESFQIKSAGELPQKVLAWANNLRDELRATIPVYSELDKLREAIEKHVKNHVDSASERFSASEAEELRAKLDELSGKFREMQEHHDLTQAEVTRLNQEIENIKANLSSYPKGTWYKTAASKLWLVVSKIGTSKESRELLAKAAGKMLGIDSE